MNKLELIQARNDSRNTVTCVVIEALYGIWSPKEKSTGWAMQRGLWWRAALASI